MDDADEAVQVEQARGGDRQAFAALTVRYWGRVYRWLFRLTGHRQRAEDLTQNAFLKAWRTLGTLRSNAAFRVWLFRIARNGLLDAPTGDRGAESGGVVEAIPSRETSPLDGLVGEESVAHLLGACDRLPVCYRAALFLRTQEEMTYEQIAAALGVTPVTARWRVCKARELLLRELAVENPSPKPR